MKEWTGGLLVVCFCLFAQWIYSQGCLPDGITFTSQEEISAFRDKYPECDRILGDLVIDETTPGNIQDLSGLISISIIEGSLIIRNNDNLQSLAGLNNLFAIGKGLNITSNQRLEDLKALSDLNQIGESIRLERNVHLKTLTGLENIAEIPGDLSISDNDQLISMQGLSKLWYVGEHLTINSNAGLIDLQGLDKISKIGNEIFIKDNASLRSLEGLAGLRDLGGDLIIDNNPFVGDFRGLRSLESIGGNTLIVNNRAVIDFQGFDALTTLGGLLQIFNNANLKSLSGLDNVRPESIGDLVILESPKLENCSQKSFCDYLGDPANSHTIRDNGEGCQSRIEVLDLCKGPGINVQPGVRVETLFYPNPTIGPVLVRGNLLQNASFIAYDMIGRRVASGDILQNRFNLSLLPSGMFIVQLSYADFSGRERLIKIE